MIKWISTLDALIRLESFSGCSVSDDWPFVDFSIVKPLSSNSTRTVLPKRAGRLSLAVCLLLTLLVSGAFFLLVLERPQRSQILTLADSYDIQWDQNVWLEEDLQQINALGRSTFRVTALPATDRLALGFWDEADEIIRQAIDRSPARRPITLYVSLHGVVDDQGRPCLVPPGSSPSDSSTWFPIIDLLTHVATAQDSKNPRPILLLLESGKVRSNWLAGITVNQFDDRLESLVDEFATQFPNVGLAVLSSAKMGQRSYAQRTGAGDVFTKYTTQALAGDADGYGKSGKRDKILELREVTDFVIDKTLAWSLSHRGFPQEPSLHVAGDSAAMKIATVSGSTIDAPKKLPAPSTANLEHLRTITEESNRLQKLQPASVDPRRWALLQRTHFAISESIFGGRGARRKTAALIDTFHQQAKDLQNAIEHSRIGNDPFAPSRFHHLQAQCWQQIKNHPSKETVRIVLDGIPNNVPMPLPMLANWLKHANLKIWGQSSYLRRIAAASEGLAQAQAKLPDELYPLANELAKELHIARRELGDVALFEREHTGKEIHVERGVSLLNVVDKYCHLVEKQLRTIEDLQEIYRHRNQALSQLPDLCQWLAEAPLRSHAHHSVHDGLHASLQLDDQLQAFIVEPNSCDQAQLAQMLGLSAKVAQSLGQLSSDHDKIVQSQLQENKDTKQTNAHDMIVANRYCRCDSNATIRMHETLRQMDSELGELAQDAAKTRLSVSSANEALAHFIGVDRTAFHPALARQKMRDCLSGSAKHSPWHRLVSLLPTADLNDEVTKHRNVAIQKRLACQARITSDDFWSEPVDRGTLYFASTTAAMLRAADNLNSDFAAWPSTRRSLQDVIDARNKATKSGLNVAATRSANREESIDVVEVNVEQPVGSNLPNGIASLVAGQNAESSLLVNGGPAREIQLRSSRSESTTDIAIEFRGARFPATFQKTPDTFSVVAQKPSKGSAKITLLPLVEREKAICFMLDCSASMNKPVEHEVARGLVSTESTKLDAATIALTEMLRRLEPTETQVGLVIYGHRMAMGRGEQGLLVQKRYNAKFPFDPTLRPFEDVEVAMPVGRFDVAQFSAARHRMSALVPWGQTPLYLSISKAIDDLKRLGNNVDKNIIVVSDGGDYQFNPTPDAIVSLKTVMQKAKENSIRVHIIGFGLDEANTIDDFHKLSQGTGGKAYDEIARASDLLRRLDDLASTDKVVVAAGNESRPVGLKETIELNKIHRANTPVKLTLADETISVPVSPKDHLQIFVDTIRGTFSSRPYRAHRPRYVPLLQASGIRSPVQSAVHEPTTTSDAVRFQMSLQRADGLVAKRPEMVWMEVRPNPDSSDIHAPAFRSSLVHWQPDMPCPVATLECRDWPSSAHDYQVRAWVCPDRPAGKKVPVVSENQDYQLLPGHDGVSYQIARDEGIVRLQLKYASHLDDSTLVIRMPGHILTSTSRYNDSDHSISVHTFASEGELQLTGSSDPESELELWTCTVNELKSKAWVLESPVVGKIQQTNHVAHR